MLNKADYDRLKAASMEYFEKAGIVVNQAERDAFQVAEYNLGCVDEIGLELIEYVNTERCCAKELVLLPGQTCPEHRHPPVCGEIGKEETFRCRMGLVYLYVEGEPNCDETTMKAIPPKDRAQYFTCRHEVVLHPGEQYTIFPNTLHWFQSGPEGCIVSEFSTKSRDEFDIYTDPDIDAAQDRTL